MLSELQLKRPLIFFDLETTGTYISKDRIVELCAIKIFPNSKDALHKTRETILQRYNPLIPIPDTASAIHGITNEMVAHEPTFKNKAKEIAEFFIGCDLAGFNIVKFDVPLIVEEFLRAGLGYNPLDGAQYIDSMTIFHRKEPRNLAAALKFYAHEEIVNAHSAEADVEATIKVLNGQLEKYSDLPKNISGLAQQFSDKKELLDYDGKFTRDERGEIIFTFGKNKGLSVANNFGMLQWMLDKDFTEHTKFIARKILSGEIA